MKVAIEVPDRSIYNILIDARIGYWARCTCQESRGREAITKLEIEERDTGRLIVLTTTSLMRGLELMAQHSPKQFGAILHGLSADSTTGDLLLQYACFGEVKYG